MSPLTKTVKPGERLERLTEELQGSWPCTILYALQLPPCNPEAAFHTVPHFQPCVAFHNSSSWFQPSCADLRGWTDPGDKEPEEGQWWNPAVSNSQFLLRFTMEGDPSMSPISPLHDGIYPSHQDHLPAAFTNISACCKHIWHLGIKIPQEFAFDQCQPRPPKRFFCPTSDFLLPKVNRLMIPWVSLFHKRHHCKAPVCVSPSW